MLNQRMDAQAIESWFMLEIITTGRVSVWKEDRSHNGGPDVYNCRHLLPLSLPLPITHLQLHLQTLVHVLHQETDDV